MSGFYRFPAIAGLDKLDGAKQMTKIIEERREAEVTLEELEIVRYPAGPDLEIETRRRFYGMELLDLIHAAETALRIEFDDDEVEQFHEAVIEKNRKRGYYGEGD